MVRYGHYTADDIEKERKGLGSVVNFFRGQPQEPDFDVLIVGAGMSGLYSAWRILLEHPDWRVGIIEKINRTGGRLDSDVVTIDGDNEVKEEEGGMRFTFDLMNNLMALLLKFNLVERIVPFPMDSGGNNRLYFRGEAFNNNQAKNDCFAIWSKLYMLKCDERGKNPSDFVSETFCLIAGDEENKHLGPVPPPEKRTPEFWQKFRLEYKWKGILMKDWQLWNLISVMGHTNEFITLLYRISGFSGPYLTNMNAGEAFQILLDFPKDPKFRTLEDGFSTLPNAMVDAIGKERIWLNTLAETIERTEDDRLRVSFTRKIETGPVREEVPGSITATHLILAIPRLALEKVFVRSPVFTNLREVHAKNLWNSILTTTNQALVKVNLYYEKGWWGSTGNPAVDFGPCFSDLPLGSVYPFYTIDQELFAALEYQSYYGDQGVPPDMKAKIDAINQSKFNKPAALTIYCDFLNVEFWNALQKNGDLFKSPLQDKYKDQMYPASLKVVEQATHFFKLLFNTDNVPDPVLTSARIWSGTTEFFVPPSEQVGFGVHQWALNAQDNDTMQILAKPIPGVNLYNCGEAYSDFQGWVEGALRSADLVLAKPPFNLKPIAQVYKEETGLTPTEAITGKYDAISIERIRTYIDPNFPRDAFADLHCAGR